MPLAARDTCYVCRRARIVCVCGDAVPVATRTRVVFFQHPGEAWSYIGTTRLAHLSLPGSELIVGADLAGDPRVEEALRAPDGREAVLLFPGPDARPAEALAGGPPVTLVVVDGTWPEARHLVHRTPLLRALPRVGIRPAARSRYRIRLQPRATCLSTIEATVAALSALEGDATRFEPLLRAFDKMVDRQIEVARSQGRWIVRDLAAERAARPVPHGLRADPSSVVVLHAETLNRREGGRLVADLVHVVARRLSGGPCLDLVTRTAVPLRDDQVVYVGLERGDVDRAVLGPELAARLGAFLRPDDHVLVWGFYGANALGALAGMRLPLVDLRGATKGVLLRPVRFAADALLELDLVAGPPRARGRAGQRLEALAAIAGALRAGRGLAEVPA